MTSAAAAPQIPPPLVEKLRATQLPPPDERRAIRKSAGATLAEMAAELGVSEMVMSRWERGINKPPRAKALTYRRLLDALSVLASGVNDTGCKT